MALKATFDISVENIRFLTRQNGDRVDMRGIHVPGDQAAELAKMINTPPGTMLEVQIKEK